MMQEEVPTIVVRDSMPRSQSSGHVRPTTVVIKHTPEVQHIPAPNYTVQPTPNPDPNPAPVVVTLNPSYFHAWPGILMLIEVFFGIICMACASPAALPGTSWFLFVVVTSFILTILWIFIHLLSLQTTIQMPVGLPWLSMEFWFNVGVTVLYTTAFITQLAVWSPFFTSRLHYFYRNSNLAAGCFGLFNTIAYAISCYLLNRNR